MLAENRFLYQGRGSSALTACVFGRGGVEAQVGEITK